MAVPSRWLVALLLLTASPLAAQSTDAGRAPNVVMILMDDLGYGDIGSYGVPDAKTPNIDRLAREGVRLTDFYANGANCSPTRAGFVTGRYQQRAGIEYPLGMLRSDSTFGLPPSATSLPALLKTRDYSTGLIGKWHLGWKPEFSPRRHGFDEFWGMLGGHADYYDKTGEFGWHDLYQDDQPVTDTTYLTDAITAHANDFIERHRAAPFFVEVAYNATHWPFQRPGLPADARRRGDNLRDGTRADYVAMLESADRGVGRLLATLDRLGLARNTLVIFTSDNGGEWLSRNAPLFHRKSTLWEGGIRIPALLRWPARLPAGVVSRQVGITMDLTATILAAAGVAPPAEYRPEGIDLVPLLASRRTTERTLYWRSTLPARPQRAVRVGRWKYLKDGGHEFVFDLARDPGERRDLIQTESARLPEFRRLVAAWEADVDSSRAATQRAAGAAR